ncbi:MAG: HNH endonuclease [Nitrospirales bacterium]
MTPKSIRSHLKPYSISAKRRTTVAHAFASALAPCDVFDEQKVEAALIALGQTDLNQLSCVYCGRPGQTWDHLENLVKAGRLNRYGHQIGNLVPSCRECNSEKGGKPFRDYIAATTRLTESEKRGLIRRLEMHLALAPPIAQLALDPEGQEILSKFLEVQAQVLRLMEQADSYAKALRKRRDG